MLPLLLHAYESISTDAVIEVQCPGCGYKLNPITDQTKHASKLTPKITEEMIADEEGEGNSNIFEVVEDEDSSRAVDEDDKRDEESLRRKGYMILSSN
jgi:predicted Zn-ribbon and HTH transcriptional regulator